MNYHGVLNLQAMQACSDVTLVGAQILKSLHWIEEKNIAIIAIESFDWKSQENISETH